MSGTTATEGHGVQGPAATDLGPVGARAEGPPFLLLTGHDYRSRRRANLHFIADELKTFGATRFFSAGFSRLSTLSGDPRVNLAARANRVETVNGIECYLWKSVLHPFNPRRSWLDGAARLGFRFYARSIPETLKSWIRRSRTIIIESGLPLIFFETAKRLNPAATVIYLASDDLATIGCAPYLVETFDRTIGRYDYAALPSRALASAFPAGITTFFVRHGLDTAALAAPGPSPFEAGPNGVSVGSMLFDPRFFEVAARAFPAVRFHVIGAGPAAASLQADNVRIYGEMPFRETIAYLAHADFGIAPYDGGRVSPYLAETSMKLMQYEALGLPSVCPRAATGQRRGRFGYDPDDVGSVTAAIDAALACGRFAGSPMPTWREVTLRLLDPDRFPDTGIGSVPGEAGTDVHAPALQGAEG